jgi:opacity protein-like surface antigen
MKLIKTFGLITGLALLGQTNATEAKSWLYTGIGIGVTSAKADLSYKTLGHSSDLVKVGGEGPNYGVFLGYHYAIQESPLFVRAEIGAQHHNLSFIQDEKIHGVHIKSHTYLKTNNSLVYKLKGGVLIKDLMIHGSFGVANTNWRMSLSFEGGTSKGASEKFDRIGSLFGFGIDYKINPNWMVGMEHTFTEYKELKMQIDRCDFKMKPKIQVTNFRLTYVF